MGLCCWLLLLVWLVWLEERAEPQPQSDVIIDGLLTTELALCPWVYKYMQALQRSSSWWWIVAGAWCQDLTRTTNKLRIIAFHPWEKWRHGEGAVLINIFRMQQTSGVLSRLLQLQLQSGWLEVYRVHIRFWDLLLNACHFRQPIVKNLSATISNWNVRKGIICWGWWWGQIGSWEDRCECRRYSG